MTDIGATGEGSPGASSGAARGTLPDAAAAARAASEPVALDWVGMRGISIPLQTSLPNAQFGAAMVDVLVDFNDCNVRGIHMSRMYDRLQQGLAMLSPDTSVLKQAVNAVLESQTAASTRAQIEIRTELLLRRPALVSDLAGWQRYPLVLRAREDSDGLRFEMEVRVGYSSTCPSSAALAQQALAEALRTRFQLPSADVNAVAEWIASADGAVATAHAQRSELRLRLLLCAESDWPDFEELIDRCEAALGTPLQTAVKRVDEKEFARRNAQNLMFCEDAARRVHAALARFATDDIADFDIRVAHLESLHAHDAVARVTRSGNYQSLAALD